MAREFSWSRLRRAVADVCLPAKEAKDMIPRVVAGLGLLGFTIGASIKPETFLPGPVVGRVALALLLLFVLSWNVQVAYRLRSELDRLRNAAKVHAVLPAVQRERLHRIKELAGRICEALQGIGTGDLMTLIGQLRAEASAIREIEEVWAIAAFYALNIATWLEAVASVDDAQKREEMLAALRSRQIRYYDNLIEVCNYVLENYPSPDTVRGA